MSGTISPTPSIGMGPNEGVQKPQTKEASPPYDHYGPGRPSKLLILFTHGEVIHQMSEPKIDDIYEDLDLGDEQVTSNECWAPEEPEDVPDRVYKDLRLGTEQVTSNECYDVGEK